LKLQEHDALGLQPKFSVVKKTGANPANPGHAAFSNSAAHANFTAYDLSSRDLNRLDDFCEFWRQFRVRNGIFLILVKIRKVFESQLEALG
jgi:hypothetical protein